MNLLRQLITALLAVSTLLLATSHALALDDWVQAVDVAVCYRGAGYKKALARVEQLAKEHQINGFALEFHHEKDGEIHEISFQDKSEGFVVVVKDSTIQAARKLLRAEIKAGLRLTMLHRSLFFPYRNAREFIRKNGSWDSPDLQAYREEEESNRKVMEEFQRAQPPANSHP